MRIVGLSFFSLIYRYCWLVFLYPIPSLPNARMRSSLTNRWTYKPTRADRSGRACIEVRSQMYASPDYTVVWQGLRPRFIKIRTSLADFDLAFGKRYSIYLNYKDNSSV
jgi:hypothetical protein